jgi:hypothetical protein
VNHSRTSAAESWPWKFPVNLFLSETRKMAISLVGSVGLLNQPLRHQCSARWCVRALRDHRCPSQARRCVALGWPWSRSGINFFFVSGNK